MYAYLLPGRREPLQLLEALLVRAKCKGRGSLCLFHYRLVGAALQVDDVSLWCELSEGNI